MRKDLRPNSIRALTGAYNRWYIQRFIRPQFDSLGEACAILKPKYLRLLGNNIHAGKFLHIICDAAKPVSITAWKSKQQHGRITIGNYCLISPGVNLASAEALTLGDNCMLAAEVTISDSDWHGTYNRVRPFRCSAPVTLGNNVWVGHRAIIGKGVSIGDNTIVGAGAVVTASLPANVIAAGNPAKVVKHLSPNKRMLKREFLFDRPADYWQSQQELERAFGTGNSFINWFRSLFKPNQHD
ncbi:acyltransferase [Teredinibacter waterburyi]|jgi:Acetyltransferase (isoleucine patch superfamily)|uniref:acyltransferase n=1 Tax=Teredinibacter waterburyi TaxID=1500538 RepID=UPI00165F874D|nr:acyltransferase [Teredinibacter waterburyi]